ncbi:hypothetical protein DFP72DRAFT_867281 [Ephemerocybe angulata]|uniref:Sugar phosphate transporter domain-containing protein n=1 Tax=Ephemerocybe angulata TaxID=980116 RepID=A0A8H6IJM2_9AGAR|nr:hypothetical protein DFP72DRAFT_867281 [Tulosesus angulatus]
MAPLDANGLKVAGVVAFYMVSALVMVFVNKAVLNNSPDLPLFFLLVQLLIAVILLHISALFTKRIEIPTLDVKVAKSLVPVVSVNIIGLVFNTLCLRDVEASFFQIARGLVLPLTIAVSCAHTRTTPSQKVVGAAGIVTLGFMLGVAPSKDLPVSAIPSTLSLIYGVMSSVFIAIHAVLIKSSLPSCNNSTIQLAWWTNAGSAVILLPFVFLHGEPWKLIDLYSNGAWDGRVFLYGSLVTGVFGFLLCVSGLLSIKVTSPVTHMFSSAARSVLQTLIGVMAFKDILTTNRALSIGTILCGTMFYTWLKSRENSPASQAPPRRNADVELGSTQEERVGLKYDASNEKH